MEDTTGRPSRSPEASGRSGPAYIRRRVARSPVAIERVKRYHCACSCACSSSGCNDVAVEFKARPRGGPVWSSAPLVRSRGRGASSPARGRPRPVTHRSSSSRASNCSTGRHRQTGTPRRHGPLEPGGGGLTGCPLAWNGDPRTLRQRPEPRPRTAAPPSAARAARRGSSRDELAATRSVRRARRSFHRKASLKNRWRRGPEREGSGRSPTSLRQTALAFRPTDEREKPVCQCPTGSHRGSTCWCYRISCRTVAGTDAKPSWTGDSSSNRS